MKHFSQEKYEAFAGGNIHWTAIPKNGDVYDFKSFFAYKVDGQWFVANWSNTDALTAQQTLRRMVTRTQERLAR